MNRASINWFLTLTLVFDFHEEDKYDRPASVSLESLENDYLEGLLQQNTLPANGVAPKGSSKCLRKPQLEQLKLYWLLSFFFTRIQNFFRELKKTKYNFFPN